MRGNNDNDCIQQKLNGHGISARRWKCSLEATETGRQKCKETTKGDYESMNELDWEAW